MAVESWPEKTRKKIRVTELITRLSMHALEEPDPQTGKPVKMSTTQVKAATVLIDKVLPNLQSIEQLVWDANLSMTESEAKAKLVELANKNPELTKILAEHFLPSQGKPVIETKEYVKVSEHSLTDDVSGHLHNKETELEQAREGMKSWDSTDKQ